MLFLRSTLTITALHKLASAAQCTGSQTRSIKRWVAPTLHEIRRRSLKLAEKQIAANATRRSEYIDWNYRAELFAFSKRFHEDFQLPLLQAAFTQHSYILQEEKRRKELGIETITDGNEIHGGDNTQLSHQGESLARNYVATFLRHSLPKLPAIGQNAYIEYLLNPSMLAHIATNLGFKELLLSANYPPTEDDLARSLLATIGALAESNNGNSMRANLFVRDFICTQLNQRDPLDVWPIENPIQMLKDFCKADGLPPLEPRLLGSCGTNTVLAAYHVGIYTTIKGGNNEHLMIGRGFGENVETAIHTASLDALLRMFGTREDCRPIDFKVQLNVTEDKNRERIQAQ